MVHIHNGILLRNEAMPFAATGTDLQIIIVREVNQTAKQMPYNISYM